MADEQRWLTMSAGRTARNTGVWLTGVLSCQRYAYCVIILRWGSYYVLKGVFGFGIGDKEGWKRLEDELEDELSDVGAELKDVFDKIGDKFKFVCISPDLMESVEEMAGSQREHVVMVRVDDETKSKLDLWVETDAVKSRSEAAALFIREGLKVRQAELEQLEESLDDLDKARQRVRDKGREVFGGRKDPAS